MKNKIYTLVVGIMLIITGIGLSLDVLNIYDFRFLLDGWWTLFIIIPSIIGIIFNGPRWLYVISLTIGVLLFLTSRGIIGYEQLIALVIPIAIIFVGVFLIKYAIGKNNNSNNIPNNYDNGNVVVVNDDNNKND